LPEYKSSGASGADLFAAFDGPMIDIGPGERAAIATGIALEIPTGTEVQVRSRSGLAASHGIIVLNSPGTIDSDYRGEVKVILYNTSDKSFSVRSGDRIALMVIAPILHSQFEQADELSKSERGNDGFGSTGR
jgi:dUTP pyrophosphatase